MRCFDNIAKLIRNRRLNHPKEYSQSELSHLLGYKNGQFISNVERGLCNIPLKMLNRVSNVLDITTAELKSSILDDHEKTLENYFNLANKEAKIHPTKDQASAEFASSQDTDLENKYLKHG